DRGRAAPRHDEDHVVAELPRGLTRLAGCDLADIEAGHRFRPGDVVEGRGDAALAPGLERHGPERGSRIAAVQIEPEVVLDPPLIGSAPVPRDPDAGFGRRHAFPLSRRIVRSEWPSPFVPAQAGTQGPNVLA